MGKEEDAKKAAEELAERKAAEARKKEEDEKAMRALQHSITLVQLNEQKEK